MRPGLALLGMQIAHKLLMLKVCGLIQKFGSQTGFEHFVFLLQHI